MANCIETWYTSTGTQYTIKLVKWLSYICPLTFLRKSQISETYEFYGNSAKKDISSENTYKEFLVCRRSELNAQYLAGKIFLPYAFVLQIL